MPRLLLPVVPFREEAASAVLWSPVVEEASRVPFAAGAATVGMDCGGIETGLGREEVEGCKRRRSETVTIGGVSSS